MQHPRDLVSYWVLGYEASIPQRLPEKFRARRSPFLGALGEEDRKAPAYILGPYAVALDRDAQVGRVAPWSGKEMLAVGRLSIAGHQQC